MAALTLPKLPKLRELTRLQALLLLGGAFVFGACAWASGRYELIADRSASVPESAVLAVSVPRRTEDWIALETILPEPAKQALSQAEPDRSATIFAVSDQDGSLQWGLREAMDSIPPGSIKKTYRLVPKNTAAVGFVRLDGRRVPFEASLFSGGLRLTVGRAFRGPTLKANPFAPGRRLNRPMPDQIAYLEKPAGVSWSRIIGPLGAQLQRFQALAGVWSLPGRVEMTISASKKAEVLSPFTLYYRPENGSVSQKHALDPFARELLSEVSPETVAVQLPDKSKMTELRQNTASVLMKSTPTPHGEVARYSVPNGHGGLAAFYDQTGENWLSTELGFVEAAILGNINDSATGTVCETSGQDGFVSIQQDENGHWPSEIVQSWPYFDGMKRFTVSINSLESGLLTICGYL